MLMMKKSQARNIVYDELKPLFADRGFSLIKAKWYGFKSDEPFGFTWFYFDFESYGELQYLIFAGNQKINLVEEIFHQVAEKYSFNVPILDQSVTLFANYFTLTNERQNEIGYRQPAYNVDEFSSILHRVKNFLQEEAIPEFDRFSDIRNIDQIINGDDFWKDDWQKPLGFSNGFVFRRIIIAHLCKNPGFKKIFNYHLSYSEDYVRNNPGTEPIKRIDGLSNLEYLSKILQTVKPIY
jgi:hypothetical protein